MTLRDIGDWLSDFWETLRLDVQIVFSENILDWPLWSFFVIVGFFLIITISSLSTVREEEEADMDEGFAGTIWPPLIGFCCIGYAIFAAFTGRHDIPVWLGFAGLISWPIFGYSFLLKLKKRFKK